MLVITEYDQLSDAKSWLDTYSYSKYTHMGGFIEEGHYGTSLISYKLIVRWEIEDEKMAQLFKLKFGGLR